MISWKIFGEENVIYKDRNSPVKEMNFTYLTIFIISNNLNISFIMF